MSSKGQIPPDAQTAAREAAIADYLEKERPILDDLRAVGVCVRHVQQLCISGTSEPAAVPVLATWLKRTTAPWIADTLARVMTMPFARKRPSVDALLTKFESAPNHGHWPTAKWSMGNALSVCAQPQDAQRVAALLDDQRHGTSRQMLCDALVRTKHPDARRILIDLLDEMPLHAISSLKRLRDHTAVFAIQPYVGDTRTPVRNAAKKAVTRLTQIASKEMVQLSHHPDQ